MALLFMDGFDHVGAAGANVLKKWDAGSVGGGVVAGRTGSGAGLFSADFLTKLIAVPGPTVILGAAIKIPTLSLAADILRVLEGATVHVGVKIDAAGFLAVNRGGTLLATATANPFAVGAWAYLEVKVVIHDTAGAISCRVDGVPVPFNAALTGIDTRNGATGLADRVAINGVSVAPGVVWDDLYLCDPTGPMNNDFLGICVIESLLPQPGAAGDLQDFSLSTGTDHGALVDENPPTDDTDYTFSSTVGQQDSYHYPSLALTGSILGVQTNLYTRKTDVGARTVAPILRQGTTTTPGTAVAPLTTYKYFAQVWETSPASGSAWTSADITALQAGMKVVT